MDLLNTHVHLLNSQLDLLNAVSHLLNTHHIPQKKVINPTTNCSSDTNGTSWLLPPHACRVKQSLLSVCLSVCYTKTALYEYLDY